MRRKVMVGLDFQLSREATDQELPRHPEDAPGVPRGQYTMLSKRCLIASYAKPIDVGELAGKAGMSPATFHRHFKKITFFAHHQYIKRFRLHTARMLLAHDSASAGSIASTVGYQSASQFNREFKRLYGKTPLADAKQRRASEINKDVTIV